MQAIEKGDLDALKMAVANMKANGEVHSDKCLNVCEIVSEFPMTLLAFAGYHVQRDMVTYLLSHEAGAGMPFVFTIRANSLVSE